MPARRCRSTVFVVRPTMISRGPFEEEKGELKSADFRVSKTRDNIDYHEFTETSWTIDLATVLQFHPFPT